MDFFKIGCFTFGGGMSIVAQMQQLYVEKKHVTTSEKLLDITSVGRSLPGLMISNVAMIFGYHQAGLLGGAACVFGLILPPFLVLTALTYFYTTLQDNAWVISAMTGVRAAIVPIIASAALQFAKSAFCCSPCVLVTLLTFSLYWFMGVSGIWLVVVGALSGILISTFCERRGGGDDGAA